MRSIICVYGLNLFRTLLTTLLEALPLFLVVAMTIDSIATI